MNPLEGPKSSIENERVGVIGKSDAVRLRYKPIEVCACLVVAEVTEVTALS